MECPNCNASTEKPSIGMMILAVFLFIYFAVLLSFGVIGAADGFRYGMLDCNKEWRNFDYVFPTERVGCYVGRWMAQ